MNRSLLKKVYKPAMKSCKHIPTDSPRIAQRIFIVLSYRNGQQRELTVHVRNYPIRGCVFLICSLTIIVPLLLLLMRSSCEGSFFNEG